MTHFELQGLCVLNTRPLEQGKLLTRKIRRAGGNVICCPTLAIRPGSDNWIKNLPLLDTVNQAIFISANAVKYSLMSLHQQHIQWPDDIHVIAIGQGTERALLAHGIKVDALPSKADSEHLLALPQLQYIEEQCILLFKGEGGRPLIAETLQARGASLLELSVYSRQLPVINRQSYERCWRNELVDIILFTSQQAMHNLFFLFGEQAYDWLRRTPCLVISERLANDAALLGIQTILRCTPETMMNALHHFKQGLIHERN